MFSGKGVDMQFKASVFLYALIILTALNLHEGNRKDFLKGKILVPHHLREIVKTSF